MRRVVQQVLIIFLAVLVFTAANGAPLDRIVAVVNDGVITQSQLDQQVSAMRQQLQQNHLPVPEANKLREQVLQHLIDIQLQMQAADKIGIKVTDKELNEAIEKIAQRNGISLEQLKAELQKQGVSYTDFRQEIRRQMIISQLQQKLVGPTVRITEQDVEEVMDKVRNQPADRAQAQYHVFDLLIPLSDKPTEQELSAANSRAQELVKKLKAGTDFKNIVLVESNVQPAVQGGDLGWHELSGLPDLFVPYVQRMRPGDTSDPIQAPNGIHIIKLVEVKGGGTALSGEDLRKQAQQLAFQRKLDEAVQKWLQQLRKQAYIKVM